MKIKELIEYLQQFDPEEVIYLLNGVDGGGPLPKEMIGPTTRKVGTFPNFVRIPCFAIYGE